MRVVVLGGGYAGVVATKRLEGALPADVDIVLVDEDGTHLVQHELHRVIRRPEYGDTIEIPLADVVDRAQVVTDTVTAVDRGDRRVELADSDPLDYDAAAICLGAEPAFYDIPGLEDHAIPLKRRRDADAIHEAIRGLADDGGGTVVVGGAGLAGVQAAGEIAAYAADRDAPIEVALVEQQETVVPRFGAGFQEAVRDALQGYDVAVRTNETVTSVSDTTVAIEEGASIDYDVLVWTGGIRGSPPLSGDRPRVRADLSLDDRTFVVGDAGRAIDVDGEAATASAQTAVGEARVVATNIERVIGRRPGEFQPRFERYNYQPYGWVVSVGDDAVAVVGGQVLTGRAAKTLKSTVGLGYLATSGAIREAVSVLRREFGFTGVG